MEDPWHRLLKHLLHLNEIKLLQWLKEQERLKKACKCRCRHRRGRKCPHGCGWVPNRHVA